MPNGSDFDDFLKAEGICERSTAAALLKVLATQIEAEMTAQQLTKTNMAKRMHTSRAALNRLLDDSEGLGRDDLRGRGFFAVGHSQLRDGLP